MKAKVLILSMAMAVFSLNSCGNKEEKKASVVEHEGHTHNEGEAKAFYECSMNCEKGKTYSEQGKCPVCKMDLVAVEAVHDAQELEKGKVDGNHSEHDHHEH